MLRRAVSQGQEKSLCAAHAVLRQRSRPPSAHRGDSRVTEGAAADTWATHAWGIARKEPKGRPRVDTAAHGHVGLLLKAKGNN